MQRLAKIIRNEPLKLIKLSNTAFETYHNNNNKLNKQQLKQTRSNLKCKEYKAKMTGFLRKKINSKTSKKWPATSWRTIKWVAKELFRYKKDKIRIKLKIYMKLLQEMTKKILHKSKIVFKTLQ